MADTDSRDGATRRTEGDEESGRDAAQEVVVHQVTQADDFSSDSGGYGGSDSFGPRLLAYLRQRTAILKTIASLTIVVTIWALVSEFNIVNPALFPAPKTVWDAFVSMASGGVFWSDLKVSLTRAFTGFIIGAVFGVALGLLTGQTKFFSFLLQPLFTVLRPIPAIALVPVAIVWFGIGESSKYFVVGYAVFLTTWLNTHHGVHYVPKTYILAARSLGASRKRIFPEVLVPAAAPYIVAGLRLGATVAFLALVAAELTGASAGIGFRLQEARQFIRTDRMFVGLIELGVLGALLDTLFVFISRKIVHWEV